MERDSVRAGHLKCSEQKVDHFLEVWLSSFLLRDSKSIQRKLDVAKVWRSCPVWTWKLNVITCSGHYQSGKT